MAPYTRHIIKLADHSAGTAVADALGDLTGGGTTPALDGAIRADDALVLALVAARSGATDAELLDFLDAARVAARRSRLQLRA